jgi:hypothetical protein
MPLWSKSLWRNAAETEVFEQIFCYELSTACLRFNWLT